MRIITEKCIKCMECSEVCPVGAIQKDDSGNVHINDDLCLGCGCCASCCKNSAIEFN